MLNSFPQRQGDPELLLRTFAEAMRGMPDQIVCDTARRFMTGEVDGQSLTFAPAVAEFTVEAKRLAEIRRDRVLAIEFQREVPREPIMAKLERVRRQYEGREVIAEGVDYAVFHTKTRAKELPEGSEFVASLSTIYGPRQEGT